MVTKDGQSVEFFLTPGSESDVGCLSDFPFDLPAGAQVFADRGYNDYEEDLLQEDGQITFLPMREKNSKRPLPPYLCYLQQVYRKAVETTGSLLERLLPKSIHAVTAQGFELKVVLFVLTCSINYL